MKLQALKEQNRRERVRREYTHGDRLLAAMADGAWHDFAELHPIAGHRFPDILWKRQQAKLLTYECRPLAGTARYEYRLTATPSTVAPGVAPRSPDADGGATSPGHVAPSTPGGSTPPLTPGVTFPAVPEPASPWDRYFTSGRELRPKYARVSPCAWGCGAHTYESKHPHACATRGP